MKKNLLLLLVTISSFTAWSQSEMVTIGGGYSWGRIENYSEKATGWRLNGLYELNPNDGELVHGLAIGHIRTYASATVELPGQSSYTSDYKLSTWPIYYAPKYLFGKGSAKLFVKGALGIQFSTLKITNGSDPGVLGNDFGFVGGVGGGFMKSFNENLFINLEYEWFYMSNSYYKSGVMSSAMIGIGYKF